MPTRNFTCQPKLTDFQMCQPNFQQNYGQTFGGLPNFNGMHYNNMSNNMWYPPNFGYPSPYFNMLPNNLTQNPSTQHNIRAGRQNNLNLSILDQPDPVQPPFTPDIRRTTSIAVALEKKSCLLTENLGQT